MKYRYLLLSIPIFALQTACGSSNEKDITASQLNAKPITTISAGRLLASQCTQCHGTDGISVSDIDSLVGEGDEILEEMLEMQHETKKSVMHLQAKGYNRDQVEEIADYFSSLSQNNNDRDDHDKDDDDDRNDHDRDGDDD